MTNELPLSAQVECLLYAAAEPVQVNQLAQALDVSAHDIEAALDELNQQCERRGVRVQRHGNKLQLATAPELAERVQKFLGLEPTNRLSTAALETLAIIAYKQPISRPQLEMLRGVNCDGVMHTLEARSLVQELGKADTVGHPTLYGVSFEFLQYFGLRGTHELPPVEKLAEIARAAEPLPAELADDESETLAEVALQDTPASE